MFLYLFENEISERTFSIKPWDTGQKFSTKDDVMNQSLTNHTNGVSSLDLLMRRCTTVRGEEAEWTERWTLD